MPKILYVMPVDADKERKGRLQSFLRSLASPGTDVEVIDLPGGPKDLEYYRSDHEAISMMMMDVVPEKVRSGEFDAVVIACFYDPGVRELRELLNIPVVGIGEASFHIASLLGHRFSIIVGRKKWIPKMSDNALLYGFERRIASWRSIETTVHSLHQDPLAALDSTMKEAKAAIECDMAEVIILGCAAMENSATLLRERLGVPVVDPVVAGFKTAEMLGDLRARTGLTTSKAYDYENTGIL